MPACLRCAGNVGVLLLLFPLLGKPCLILELKANKNNYEEAPLGPSGHTTPHAHDPACLVRVGAGVGADLVVALGSTPLPQAWRPDQARHGWSTSRTSCSKTLPPYQSFRTSFGRFEPASRLLGR